MYGADLYHADMLNDDSNTAGGKSLIGGGEDGGGAGGKKGKKGKKKDTKKKTKKGKKGNGGSGDHKTVVVVVDGTGVEIRDPGRIFAKKHHSVIPYVYRSKGAPLYYGLRRILPCVIVSRDCHFTMIAVQ